MKEQRRYTGTLSMLATCSDCGWTCDKKNALGVAANHSTHYKHDVTTEITNIVSYRWKDSDEKQKEKSS